MTFAAHSAAEENTPIRFPTWQSCLARSVIAPAIKAVHERTIIAFLHYCAQSHAPASIALARQLLDGGRAPRNEAAREALRWFVRMARIRSDEEIETDDARTESEPWRDSRPGAGSTPPPSARADLGGADWERDLIAALRRKGFLWRTEVTYRQWARRFARHMQPRSPYQAEGTDVADFLSKLAIEQRASAASQKQALNALVFFLQEGLHRTLGDFDFHRAHARERIPTVLTGAECQQLFTQLTGTSRLLAA